MQQVKLTGIKKKIRPAAGSTGHGVGGVGHIGRNKENIPCPIGNGPVIDKGQFAAVVMAYSQLPAIMKVKVIAGNIRNNPFFPREQQYGKGEGEIIVPVFDHVFSESIQCISPLNNPQREQE